MTLPTDGPATVAVAGSGPAVEAARAALTDAAADVVTPELSGIVDADLAVVVGLAGSDGLSRANALAREAALPWIAVEVGGVGGHARPDVDASVAGFEPGGACYACLRTRVESTIAEPAGEPTADRSAVRLAGAIAGKRAVEALGGGALGGTLREIPHAERTVLPTPNCEVCDVARSRTLARDHAGRSLDDAVSRAERAVDERLGPVAMLGERESFPAPYYLAGLADTTAFSDAAVPEHAAGVDVDWDRAFMKAVGEALERYSAGVYREREFTTAPAADLDAPVAPAEFVRPDAFPTPDSAEPLAWVPGEHLSTGDPVSLPAEFVHFPPPEERLAPAITTGLGLGNSGVEALRSGLYEVVERDATMLAWYSTFEPLGLDVDTQGVRDLAKRARAEDLEVTTLLCTQDVDVPVVAAAVHRADGDWPRFAVGSAADLDAAAAARSALCEALQNWMELRAMGPEDATDAEGAIATYADFPREVQSFVAPETTVGVAAVSDTDLDGRAELDALLERVADAGLDPYAARLTTRDVDALGFEAVRVLVPGAQPLFVEEPCFGERARTVPRDLGFQPRLDRPFHPFP